jgi:O-antigen biosynthesis protein
LTSIGCNAVRGRILVIDHKTPTPDQDSGSASAFSVLRILADAGLNVTFAPFDLKHSGRYSRALNRIGIETLTEPGWTSITDVIDTIAPRCDGLLLYRAPVASRLFDRARAVAPLLKILFHPVDLHFLRMQRQAEVGGDLDVAVAADEMRSIELDLVRRADATIVVSSHEAQMLRGLLPEAVIHQIPILREIPAIGAPRPGKLSFLRRLVGRRPERKKRRDILFIGGYEHLPNVDAVKWFVREVWPIVMARGFTERLVLVGSKMPQEVLALATEQIEVRGHVEHLSGLFAASRMSVAPLRYGGGIKGKIVTSLSYGVPVVATSMAAEGMGLQHEMNVLIADSPSEMADQIMRLSKDVELWGALSLNGYQAFLSDFSIANGAPRLLAVIGNLLES